MPTPDVVFHRLADHEYRKAIAWYRLRSPDAASRFLSAVNHAIRRIEVGTQQPSDCGSTLPLCAREKVSIYDRLSITC